MAIGRRRAPWPFGLVVDGTPMAVLEGTWVAEKVQPFSNITPTTQEYANWPAFRERALAWSEMPLGFGHGVEIQIDPEKDGFYSWADGADLSVATVWQKGPAITWFTPPTTGPIAGGEVIANKLVVIAGQYALARSSDASWPVSQNLGATGYRPELVTQNVASATNYLVVGLTAGNPWRFDGTAWTQNAAGLGQIFKLLPATRELFAWTGQNNMAKVDIASDWWNIANWSAADNFRVGDQTKSITELAATTLGTLLIVKQDGIFTLDVNGETIDLFPALKSGSDPNNGKGWGLFEGSAYVPTTNTGLLKLTPSGFYGTVVEAQEVGVEKIGDNTSPVRGRITAFEGTQFNGYASIWNPDTNTSYMLKFGGRDPSGQFIPSWHGSISHAITGTKITWLRRCTVGAPTDHERLYVGTDDGRIGWFTLACTANPAECSNYTCEPTDCFVYLPLAHLGFRADRKTIEGFSVYGTALGGDRYVRIGCRFDQAGSYRDVGNSFHDPGGSRQDFSDPIPYGYMLDVQVTLTSTGTSSPLVSSVACHHKVVPSLVLDYAGTVDARPYAKLRDGRPNRRPPWQTKQAMESAASAPFTTWLTPEEQSITVSVHEYAFKEAPDSRTRRMGWLIPFKAVGYRTNQLYGTWERIQVNAWASLAKMSWANIETL